MKEIKLQIDTNQSMESFIGWKTKLVSVICIKCGTFNEENMKISENGVYAINCKNKNCNYCYEFRELI